MTQATAITYDGITDSIAGWARRIGASKQALHVRFKSGWTIERALTTPVAQQGHASRAERLTHDGKTMTIAEWAKHTGITVAAIHGRLLRGWTIERILTTPTRQGKQP